MLTDRRRLVVIGGVSIFIVFVVAVLALMLPIGAVFTVVMPSYADTNMPNPTDYPPNYANWQKCVVERTDSTFKGWVKVPTLGNINHTTYNGIQYWAKYVKGYRNTFFYLATLDSTGLLRTYQIGGKLVAANPLKIQLPENLLQYRLAEGDSIHIDPNNLVEEVRRLKNFSPFTCK